MRFSWIYFLAIIRGLLCVAYLIEGRRVRRALQRDLQDRKAAGFNGMLSRLNEAEIFIERKRALILSLILVQTSIVIVMGARVEDRWPYVLASVLYLGVVYLVGSPSADKVRLRRELIAEAKKLERRAKA